MERKKITVLDLQRKRDAGEKITMLTAFDYATGKIADEAGIDVLLVGDSLGMVILGREHTVSVTMEEVLHHCEGVACGARHPLLVGDMPFMSYQVDVKEAIRNAGRFLKEGGMDVVKLEGGREIAATTKASNQSAPRKARQSNRRGRRASPQDNNRKPATANWPVKLLE